MASDFELSPDEARRLLAEKFGADSGMALVESVGGWHVLKGLDLLGSGLTPREALEAGAVAIDLPLVRSKFSNFGDKVVLGDQWIATARSPSMARRIAAALTFYKKDR